MPHACSTAWRASFRGPLCSWNNGLKSFQEDAEKKALSTTSLLKSFRRRRICRSVEVVPLREAWAPQRTAGYITPRSDPHPLPKQEEEHQQPPANDGVGTEERAHVLRIHG